MTQPALKQSMSFVEFTDSVFSELYRWETEYSYFNMKELADWKNTLIPLAVNLYELAQTDDAVYWWLLQQMSQLDVCKDCKEDFRKYEVFDVLSKLKREHQKTILDKCVPNHAEELQKALDDDALDTFKSMLPRIDVDDAIYKTGRVLKRAMDVHNIYERTMSHTQGDSLAILFVLFRRYYKYFANAYDNNHRSCDGIAKNIFLALYQTQYREDNNEFCEVTYNIGELWVRNLISAHLKYEGQMPQSMQKVASDILQSQNTVLFSNLSEDFNNCDTEEQEEVFLKGKGGWFELEEYSFIYTVLQVSKEVRSETTPPFSCLCTDKKKKRKRICGDAKHRDNRDKIHYKDNYVPYIESNNAISFDDLRSGRMEREFVHRMIIVKDPASQNVDFGRGSVPAQRPLNPVVKSNEEIVYPIIEQLIPSIRSFISYNLSETFLDELFKMLLIEPLNDEFFLTPRKNIAKDLLNHRCKYEFSGIKLIVFYRIIGYLIREGVIDDNPRGIANNLTPLLTKPEFKKNNERSVYKIMDSTRTYIEKASAKESTISPPGKLLIDDALKRLGRK